MTSEHFQESLQALRQRTPFRLFTVELVSGDRFEVDYPNALVVGDGVAVFVALVESQRCSITRAFAS